MVWPAGGPGNALHGLLIVLTVGVLSFLVFGTPIQPPVGDEPRYILLGANLFQHGVLSGQPFDPAISPLPTPPVGGPLTALELAVAMALDPVTRESLLCLAANPDAGDTCPLAYPGLKALHVVEISIFLLALWWITKRLTGNAAVAWLAVALALACRDLTFDAGRVLTEPSFLACIGLTLAAWLAVWDDPQSRLKAALLGVALAATILVKPAFQILLPLGLIMLAATLVLQKDPRPARVAAAAGSFLIVCLAGIVPFYLYFSLCCGTASLSAPHLLEAALSHRVAYNAMDMREWLAGWIYFLPDFGDTLTPALFPDVDPIRLGWDANSYYVYGRDVLHAEMRALTRPEPATSQLIETYVLGDPLWHSATSALLFWRGLFVGKLWGLVALPVLLAYPILKAAPNRLAFVMLCLPILAIAAIQSVISVSIPRYNIALILPMSLAVSWTALALASGFYRRFRPAS